jgi:hypothetical protein
MADQNPQHGRRQHFHRGRRGGPDRRNERRGPGPAQSSEQAPREHREHVDVEQIMREIRSRISQRHGVELTTQQIQELAARRLEAILDPRTVKPSLLEQIRRSTSTPLDAPSPSPEPTYSFEDSTLYESHRGSLRFIRRLLNPLLKLFFNPNPLISALNAQAKLNQAAALREAERERRQAEWNALHYEILQRLVLEVSRNSLEAQQMTMRIDALAAKVDFAERRARSIEGTLHQARPSPRHESAPPPAQFAQAPREPAAGDVPAAPASPEGGGPGEGSRRRRRRRRGRRSQGFTPEGAAIGAIAGPATAESRLPEGGDGADIDDADDDEGGPEIGDETEAFDGAGSPVDVAPSVESIHEESEPVASPVDVTPAEDPSSVYSSVESHEPQPSSPEPSLETREEPAPAEPPDRPRPTEPSGD